MRVSYLYAKVASSEESNDQLLVAPRFSDFSGFSSVLVNPQENVLKRLC